MRKDLTGILGTAPTLEDLTKEYILMDPRTTVANSWLVGFIAYCRDGRDGTVHPYKYLDG